MERIESYTGRAKCTRREEKIIGTACAGTVPVSMHKARYLYESRHDAMVFVDDARADASNATTDSYTYSIMLIPKADIDRRPNSSFCLEPNWPRGPAKLRDRLTKMPRSQ